MRNLYVALCGLLIVASAMIFAGCEKEVESSPKDQMAESYSYKDFMFIWSLEEKKPSWYANLDKNQFADFFELVADNDVRYLYESLGDSLNLDEKMFHQFRFKTYTLLQQKGYERFDLDFNQLSPQQVGQLIDEYFNEIAAIVVHDLNDKSLSNYWSMLTESSNLSTTRSSCSGYFSELSKSD